VKEKSVGLVWTRVDGKYRRFGVIWPWMLSVSNDKYSRGDSEAMVFKIPTRLYSGLGQSIVKLYIRSCRI
jgi:hypothetical protein